MGIGQRQCAGKRSVCREHKQALRVHVKPAHRVQYTKVFGVQQFRRQQGKYAFVAAFPVGALVAAGFVHHQVNVGGNFQRPAVKGNFITPGAHRERL